MVLFADDVVHVAVNQCAPRRSHGIDDAGQTLGAGHDAQVQVADVEISANPRHSRPLEPRSTAQVLQRNGHLGPCRQRIEPPDNCLPFGR